MELIQGARDKSDLRAIKSFLTDGGFVTLPVTVTIADRAAIYVEQRCLSNRLHVPDALIAATAAETGETLLTANVKHFRGLNAVTVKPFRP